MRTLGPKFATFFVLLIFGVPWYWRFIDIRPDALWAGMPPWFAVSVGVSAVVSVITACQFIRPWPGEKAPPTKEPGE